MSDDTRIDVYLICNAKYHDTNFARLELLTLLAEHEDVVVRVAEDYRDVEAIAESRLLLTYTCDVCPTVEQQDALMRFLMQPIMPVCSVERCSWDAPVYYELLRRGIRWGIGQLGD